MLTIFSHLLFRAIKIFAAEGADTINKTPLHNRVVCSQTASGKAKVSFAKAEGRRSLLRNARSIWDKPVSDLKLLDLLQEGVSLLLRQVFHAFHC